MSLRKLTGLLSLLLLWPLVFQAQSNVNGVPNQQVDRAGSAAVLTGTIGANQIVPDPTKNGYLYATQATGGSDIFPATPLTGVLYTSCSGLPCYEDTAGSFWNIPRLGGSNVFTAAGAASVPAMLFNGLAYAAGTATTNWPLVLLQPSGTTSTAWSTAGTYFGVNAPSGFAGNLMDLQINGVHALQVTSAGSGAFAGTVSGNAMSVTNAATAKNYLTVSNCASAGGTCASASAGMVTVAASATTVTVADTSVTANSEILLTPVSAAAAGTRLSVTCNAAPVLAWVSTQTAATSFIITVASAPTTNPECISFHIVN